MINGSIDDKRNFELQKGTIKHASFVTLLGSHLSESGDIADDIT